MVRVLPGSRAEAGGLRAGDVILAIAGVRTDRAAALSELPRPAAGESRAYRVSRDGTARAEERVVTVEFAPLPPGDLARERASIVVGLCFLMFPLLVGYRRPSRAARVLLVMGVWPSSTGPTWTTPLFVRWRRPSGRSLCWSASPRSSTSFCYFRGAVPGWSSGTWPVYLPALLLWVLLAWRLLFMPAASGALTVITNLALAVVVVGYLLAALFLVLRNYSRTDRAERKALALNGMLWGTVLGVVPAALAQLTTVFSPASELPAQDFWFVSLALIPIAWSRSAACKSEFQRSNLLPSKTCL